jgi:RNA polymerase sigma-70 factor (ECF subfamily)
MIGLGIIGGIRPASRGHGQEQHTGSSRDRTVSERDSRVPIDDIEPNLRSRVSAFESLMVPHLNAAHNLARWLTGNRDDANDVVQEAYLRAFKFFDSYYGGDGKVWLLTIVRNTFFTWRRRERQRMTSESFDELTHHSNNQAVDQEHGLVRDAEVALLQKCIENLPTEFREVIVMRELEELSYRQIADLTGVPIGTVMSRLSRARKRLAECANQWKVGRQNDVLS